MLVFSNHVSMLYNRYRLTLKQRALGMINTGVLLGYHAEPCLSLCSERQKSSSKASRGEVRSLDTKKPTHPYPQMKDCQIYKAFCKGARCVQVPIFKLSKPSWTGSIPAQWASKRSRGVLLAFAHSLKPVGIQRSGSLLERDDDELKT